MMARAIWMAAAAAWLVAASDDRPAGADLAWLSGHWATASGESWTEEYWTAPRAGIMIGLSRAGRGETLGDWEFLRLEAGEDGVPVYWASPRGRTPVGFRLVRADGANAVFENPSHDFPQRIAYRRSGETLTATISTIDGGNPMSWTFQRR
jgi:hypothetical protein